MSRSILQFLVALFVCLDNELCKSGGTRDRKMSMARLQTSLSQWHSSNSPLKLPYLTKLLWRIINKFR